MNKLKNKSITHSLFYLGIVLTFSAVVVGWWFGNRHGLAIPGSQLIAVGRLFGLVSAYGILLTVILVSRIPFIEKNFDLDELSDLHHMAGFLVLFSFLAHILFLVLGYAAPAHLGLLSQFWQLNTGFSKALLATIGTAIFFVTTIISINVARKKLSYQVWYFSHLTMYAAIIAVFFHQITSGNDFKNQPLFKIYWLLLYVFIFGLLAIYRFIRPLYYSKKYGFRVAKIVQEADCIHSIYISGKNLQKFKFIPGQYANWQFLAPKVWSESHPYSFSNPPGQNYLRLSVKTDTVYGGKLSKLAVGTKVLLDGPRGSFTPVYSSSKKVLLIGGGIGVAPFLASIGQLITQGKQVSLFYSAHDKCQCAFKQELADLQKMGLKLNYFISNEGRRICENDLKNCVCMEADIYICGPDKMSKSFQEALTCHGHPKKQLFIERFAM